MYYLVIGTIVGVALLLVSQRSRYPLHMVQVVKYKPESYRQWIEDNRQKAYSFRRPDEQVKKTLVFTDRARRLYKANLFINFLILMIIPILFIKHRHISPIIGLTIIAISLLRQQADIIHISNLLMDPIENRINMGFYKSAQERIKAREDLKVVGITGSFGKTSTKFIVEGILERKYKVLNTPESYNTPMGLSKLINNDLAEDDEVFIAEMGARKLGDIKKLAELCQPDIGILTSIGPVHMESFKNIDNIMKTKYELIDQLPTDGVAIFNYDNEHIRKLADKTFKEKILFGFDNVEELDIYADDIFVSKAGSSFNLKDKDGNKIRCTSKLLGKQNIYNLLAGAAVAKVLGLSLEEICQAISRVQPLDHILNMKESDSGLIVIDNTLNANPIGARAALDVLVQFKEGKKIVVTPGMAELGEMEEAANREFGKDMGKVCDYVILLGQKRCQQIYDGLMDTKFNPDNIFVVDNLDQAQEQIDRLAGPGDQVLFENAIPDGHNE